MTASNLLTLKSVEVIDSANEVPELVGKFTTGTTSSIPLESVDVIPSTAEAMSATSTLTTGEVKITNKDYKSWQQCLKKAPRQLKVRDCDCEEAIYELAKSGSGLDIYSMTAFFPTPYNLAMSLFVAFIQLLVVPGVVFYVMQQSDVYLSNNGTAAVCNAFAENRVERPWVAKGTAVVLALYVSVFVLIAFAKIRQGWLPNVVSNGPIANVAVLPLLPVGFAINIWALFISSVGTTALLVVTDEPIDLILNSLALSFIAELDDAIVPDTLYKAAESLFDPANIDPNERQKVAKAVDRFFEYSLPVFLWFATTFAICSPIYIAVCY